MSKPKWYNPTGDSDWDRYYKMFYIVWTPVLFLVLLLLLVNGSRTL